MIRFPIVTGNLQGVTDPSDNVLHAALDVLAGAALFMGQEAAPIATKLRARLSGRIVGVHQSRTDRDKAGVCLVWDKSRLTLAESGYVLLASPEPGDDMRKRYGAWGRFKVRYRGTEFVTLSGHRPLRSTGDQEEHDRNLAAWVSRQRVPVIIGEDFNSTPGDVARALMRHGSGEVFPTGVGIDGFLHTRGIVLGEAFALPRSTSDHRAVASICTIPD